MREASLATPLGGEGWAELGKGKVESEADLALPKWSGQVEAVAMNSLLFHTRATLARQASLGRGGALAIHIVVVN